jgi:hypothetical protein
VQRLVAKLFSGCPRRELSLHNDLGARHSSLLCDTDRAAVAAACKAELVRRLTEQHSSDLTECFELQNFGLHASALELLKPSAEVAAERDAARQVLDEQALLEQWRPLGPAQRPEFGAGRLTTFSGDLKAHSAAAAKLVQWWQHSTLKSCVNAHADTEKNEYTAAVALTQKHKRPLLDHPARLILLYDPNFAGNYLRVDCPAAKLPGSKLLDLESGTARCSTGADGRFRRPAVLPRSPVRASRYGGRVRIRAARRSGEMAARPSCTRSCSATSPSRRRASLGEFARLSGEDPGSRPRSRSPMR